MDYEDEVASEITDTPPTPSELSFQDAYNMSMDPQRRLTLAFSLTVLQGIPFELSLVVINMLRFSGGDENWLILALSSNAITTGTRF